MHGRRCELRGGRDGRDDEDAGAPKGIFQAGFWLGEETWGHASVRKRRVFTVGRRHKGFLIAVMEVHGRKSICASSLLFCLLR